MKIVEDPAKLQERSGKNWKLKILRAYQRTKNIYHFLQSRFWQAYYGFPDKGMKIYGVTGTNGKTTTCILLGNILRQAHEPDKVGLLTTIVFWIGAKEIINKTKMTTMDSRLVWQYIRQMKDAQVKHLVLEVTSHALDQYRLAGIKMDGAIITNIAREHLDYHKTMEKYTVAKLKIIGYIKNSGTLVYKGDDEWIRKGLQKNPKSKIQMSNQIQNPNVKLKLSPFTSEKASSTKTSLLGEVNKENVLAASLLARGIGIDEIVIGRGVAKVNHVPGRMEWVTLPPAQPRSEAAASTAGDKGGLRGVKTPSSSPLSEGGLPRVLIDYAVTPGALERLYREIKQQTTGKIYAVLGACGNRDRGKRPDMTRVVAKYASELVLTREDPWTENEEQIFKDLEEGLKNHPLTPSLVRRGKFSWQRIIDRREAIKYCLDKADSGDIVVVTGKGAEEGMAIGKTMVPWSDKKIILELLTDLAGAKSNDQ